MERRPLPTPGKSRHLVSGGNGSPRSHPQADRLADLEAAIVNIQNTLDVQFKRIAAMQAELDHLTAKNRSWELTMPNERRPRV